MKYLFAILLLLCLSDVSAFRSNCFIIDVEPAPYSHGEEPVYWINYVCYHDNNERGYSTVNISSTIEQINDLANEHYFTTAPVIPMPPPPRDTRSERPKYNKP